MVDAVYVSARRVWARVDDAGDTRGGRRGGLLGARKMAGERGTFVKHTLWRAKAKRDKLIGRIAFQLLLQIIYPTFSESSHQSRIPACGLVRTCAPHMRSFYLL